MAGVRFTVMQGSINWVTVSMPPAAVWAVGTVKDHRRDPRSPGAGWSLGGFLRHAAAQLWRALAVTWTQSEL